MAQTRKVNGHSEVATIPPPAVPVERSVSISPPKFEEAVVSIRGTSPYVQHRFSLKARLKMEATQKAGTQAKSRKVREARNPEQDYKEASYISKDGWYGIPASSIRNACISACKLVGFHMTRAKLSIFVIPDGFDPVEGIPLVRIYGNPRMHSTFARNDNGGADLRYRPMWDEWTARVKVRWDSEQFSATDILNLLARVGLQVGLGEGRADSKESNGLGWGHFEVMG